MQQTVWIPALHRDLAGGAETVIVEANTIGEVIDQLEAKFPGFAARLSEDGKMRANIAVAINGEITHRGLRQNLTEPSEVHFIPALSGG
ncbi:N/A [soil metagenome]